MSDHANTAITDPDGPWKVAHDALFTYVATLMERRAGAVVDRAFDAYIEAKAAAMGDPLLPPDEDCRACCGTGCRLGPDGCNGRAHLFIGCATCIACRGSGLASNGSDRA